MDHTYAGQNYVGHSYVRHDHVGHNYTSHYYMGHNYTGHNYMDHNYIWRPGRRGRPQKSAAEKKIGSTRSLRGPYMHGERNQPCGHTSGAHASMHACHAHARGRHARHLGLPRRERAECGSLLLFFSRSMPTASAEKAGPRAGTREVSNGCQIGGGPLGVSRRHVPRPAGREKKGGSALGRPSSARGSALPLDIRRGNDHVVPRSGTMPSFGPKVSTNSALSAATHTSATSASPTPPPAATPLTAATSGMGRECSSFIMGFHLCSML